MLLLRSPLLRALSRVTVADGNTAVHVEAAAKGTLALELAAAWEGEGISMKCVRRALRTDMQPFKLILICFSVPNLF